MDEAIFRAPGMTVARPDVKSKPLVELARRVTIANNHHHMIDPAQLRIHVQPFARALLASSL